MAAQKVRELVNWGDAALEQSDLEDAENAYARAIQASRESGEGVALGLDGLMRLASRYVMLGFLGRPHALHKYFIETDTLQVSRDLKELAALRDSQGDLRGYEMILQRVLELKLDALGPAHEETLAALQDAALVLQTQGKSPEHLYKLAFSRKAEDWVDDDEPHSDVVEAAPPAAAGVDLSAASTEFSPSAQQVSFEAVSEQPVESVVASNLRDQELVEAPFAAAVDESFLWESVESAGPADRPSTVSFGSRRPVEQPAPASTDAPSGGGFFQGQVNAMLQEPGTEPQPFTSSSYSAFGVPVAVPKNEIDYQQRVQSLLSPDAANGDSGGNPDEPGLDEWTQETGDHIPVYSEAERVTESIGESSPVAWAPASPGAAWGLEEQEFENSGGMSTTAPPQDFWSSTSTADAAWGDDSGSNGPDEWTTQPAGPVPSYESPSTPPWFANSDDKWAQAPANAAPNLVSPVSSETNQNRVNDAFKPAQAGFDASSWAHEPPAHSGNLQAPGTSDEDMWTRETSATMPAYSDASSWAHEPPAHSGNLQAAGNSDDDIWTRETSATMPAYSDASSWAQELPPESGQLPAAGNSDGDIWTRETSATMPAYSDASSWAQELPAESGQLPTDGNSDDDIWTRETSATMPAYSDASSWAQELPPESPAAFGVETPGGFGQKGLDGGFATENSVSSDYSEWAQEPPAASSFADWAATPGGAGRIEVSTESYDDWAQSPDTIGKQTDSDPTYSDWAQSPTAAPISPTKSEAEPFDESWGQNRIPQFVPVDDFSETSDRIPVYNPTTALTSDVGSPEPAQPGVIGAPPVVTPSPVPEPAPAPDLAPASKAELSSESVSAPDTGAFTKCFEYLQLRVARCAEDQQVALLGGIKDMVLACLDGAAQLIDTHEAALVKPGTISRLDWKILTDLSEMYQKISGTNAAAYELSLIYSLSMRIVHLGATHRDSRLTLERLLRLHALLGVVDEGKNLEQLVTTLVSVNKGMSQVSEAPLVEPSSSSSSSSSSSLPSQNSRIDTDAATNPSETPEMLPISRRVQPVARKETTSAADPMSTIRAHFLMLSKNPPAEESIKIIQEVRTEFRKLSPSDAAPFLSRLLELSTNLLGEDHDETAVCLFDAACIARALQRPGFERAFQKAFQLQLKAGRVPSPELAIEYASVCKVWDDSEQGRLRTRSVAVTSIHFGLTHDRTRAIVAPPDKRLVTLEFDSVPDDNDNVVNQPKPRQVQPILDELPSNPSQRAEMLLRASAELEKKRFMSADQIQISDAIHDACAIYNALQLGDSGWKHVSRVEHAVLALMLELQALKFFDRKNYRESDRVMETVEKIRLGILPTNHPDIALSRFRRGLLLVKHADFAGAEGFYVESDRMLESMRSDHLLLHSAILNNMAVLKYRRGDYVQALRLFERAYGQIESMTDVNLQISVCRANIEKTTLRCAQ